MFRCCGKPAIHPSKTVLTPVFIGVIGALHLRLGVSSIDARSRQNGRFPHHCMTWRLGRFGGARWL
jgi:hypothetical protein